MPSISGPPMETRLLYQQLKALFIKKQNQPNKTTQNNPNPKCHPGKCTTESEVEDIFYPAGLRPSVRCYWQNELQTASGGWGGVTPALETQWVCVARKRGLRSSSLKRILLLCPQLLLLECPFLSNQPREQPELCHPMSCHSLIYSSI